MAGTRDLIEKTDFLVADRMILRDHWRAHAVLPAGRDHLRGSHRARRRRPVSRAAVRPGSSEQRSFCDEDGIYDPRLVSDGLLLGLKGTFSELELSIFRQRSQEALRLKARLRSIVTANAWSGVS
jgi:hypothetical protein